MKPEDKILTYAQAKELKFFCSQVTGVITDYYKVKDKVDLFDSRISRLEKTCTLIEQFFGEKIEPMELTKSVFDEETK